jgi:hypothetical protein
MPIADAMVEVLEFDFDVSLLIDELRPRAWIGMGMGMEVTKEAVPHWLQVLYHIRFYQVFKHRGGTIGSRSTFLAGFHLPPFPLLCWKTGGDAADVVAIRDDNHCPVFKH